MRTEHFLFHVIGITSKSRVKFVQGKGISLYPRNQIGEQPKLQIN